jgi:hypothetical protein
MPSNKKLAKIGLVFASVIDLLLITGAIASAIFIPGNTEGNYWLIANWVHLPLFIWAFIVGITSEKNKRTSLSVIVVGLFALIFDGISVYGRVHLLTSCGSSDSDDECHDYTKINWVLAFIVLGWIAVDVAYLTFGGFKYAYAKEADGYKHVVVSPTKGSKRKKNKKPTDVESVIPSSSASVHQRITVAAPAAVGGGANNEMF